MRSAVIYSSLTGNTKAMAEAALEVMPQGAELIPVKDAPDASGYGLLALGFWVSKSGPDPRMAAYMKTLQGKNLLLFGTMAGYPDSPYGARVRANAEALVAGNRVLGTFLCMGKITEKRFQQYMNGDLQESRHPLTPEREARLREAMLHPNELDFAAICAAFKGNIKLL